MQRWNSTFRCCACNFFIPSCIFAKSDFLILPLNFEFLFLVCLQRDMFAVGGHESTLLCCIGVSDRRSVIVTSFFLSKQICVFYIFVLLLLLSFSRKAHSTLYWLRKGASFYLCCSYWAYCFLLLCCYCCYNDRNNKMKTFIIFKGSSLNIVLVAKTGDQVQPLHYWIGRNQNRQPTSLNAFLPYDKIHIPICIIQCDNFLP